MPERRPNICCGCGRSGFSSRTWSVSKGGSAPTKPGFAVSSVLSPRYSITGRGTEERGSWGSGNTGTPTALRPAASDLSTILRRSARSLPHRRKTVKKILDLHYDMVSGQRRKLSPLEADDSLRFSSAAEALQQQRRPHGVFQEQNKKRAFSDTNYGTCGYKKRQKREKEKDGEQKRPRLYC